MERKVGERQLERLNLIATTSLHCLCDVFRFFAMLPFDTAFFLLMIDYFGLLGRLFIRVCIFYLLIFILIESFFFPELFFFFYIIIIFALDYFFFLAEIVIEFLIKDITYMSHFPCPLLPSLASAHLIDLLNIDLESRIFLIFFLLGLRVVSSEILAFLLHDPIECRREVLCPDTTLFLFLTQSRA